MTAVTAAARAPNFRLASDISLLYLRDQRYIGVISPEGTMFDGFFDFGRCCEPGPGARARWRGGAGWGGFEAFMGDLWGAGSGGGAGPGPRGPRWRGGRMFEQGDIKYVILRLLEEKPRHGYDIIKELEERFGGMYAPSPGTIYPTLTLLEDLGYARSLPEEGGRKIYEITDAGRQHLAEHRARVDSIFERASGFMEGIFGPSTTEVRGAFKQLVRAAFSAVARRPEDRATLDRVRDILARAAAELEALDR